MENVTQPRLAKYWAWETGLQPLLDPPVNPPPWMTTITGRLSPAPCGT